MLYHPKLLHNQVLIDTNADFVESVPKQSNVSEDSWIDTYRPQIVGCLGGL